MFKGRYTNEGIDMRKVFHVVGVAKTNIRFDPVQLLTGLRLNKDAKLLTKPADMPLTNLLATERK